MEKQKTVKDVKLKQLKLTLPIRIKVTTRKYFILNLNNYRNTHYQTLHKAKKEYAKVIRETLNDKYRNFRFKKKVQLTLILFEPDKRRRDLSNALSIVDKFLLDTLVEYGILRDDSVHDVPRCIYKYGGMDKENPRVEVILKEIK